MLLTFAFMGILIIGAIVLEYIDELFESGFGILALLDRLCKKKDREFKIYDLKDENTKTERTKIDFTPMTKRS